VTRVEVTVRDEGTVMRKSWSLVFPYFAGAILLACSAGARGEQDPFVKWASAHALAVATLEMRGDLSDLVPLKSRVRSARVIAIGEPTHGAHEPLAFRNRLIRFLVEQTGVTAVTIESGFTESWAVDSFVRGGPGNAADIARDHLTDRFGHLDENRELIQWLRDYNTAARAKGHRRVRFYGIDVSGGGRLDGPRHAIDFALDFLSRADRAEAERIRAPLASVLPPADDDVFGDLPPSALARFEASFPALAEAMARDRERLITRSSAEEYSWALHNLEVARQLARVIRETPPFPQLRPGESLEHAMCSGPIPTAESVATRDFAMAENVRWVVDHEGPEGRVVVFAHDGHVMMLDRGIWACFPKPLSIGTFLRRSYGKDLFVIATSSASAAATLSPPMPGTDKPESLSNSIDSALANVGLPRMILDIRSARQDPEAWRWLSRQRAIRLNIVAHGLMTPSVAADAFFFVNRLTPARRN
jgi:erythromycin esterase